MNKEYLEELEAYRGKLDAQVEALKNIPILPDWADLYSVEIIAPGSFRIDIPYSEEKLLILEKLLGVGDAWEFLRTNKVYNANKKVSYIHKATFIPLEVFMLLDMDGSDFERVQIGEEIEPIYGRAKNEA